MKLADSRLALRDKCRLNHRAILWIRRTKLQFAIRVKCSRHLLEKPSDARICGVELLLTVIRLSQIDRNPQT